MFVRTEILHCQKSIRLELIIVFYSNSTKEMHFRSKNSVMWKKAFIFVAKFFAKKRSGKRAFTPQTPHLRPVYKCIRLPRVPLTAF